MTATRPTLFDVNTKIQVLELNIKNIEKGVEALVLNIKSGSDTYNTFGLILQRIQDKQENQDRNIGLNAKDVAALKTQVEAIVEWKIGLHEVPQEIKTLKTAIDNLKIWRAGIPATVISSIATAIAVWVAAKGGKL